MRMRHSANLPQCTWTSGAPLKIEHASAYNKLGHNPSPVDHLKEQCSQQCHAIHSSGVLSSVPYSLKCCCMSAMGQFPSCNTESVYMNGDEWSVCYTDLYVNTLCIKKWCTSFLVQNFFFFVQIKHMIISVSGYHNLITTLHWITVFMSKDLQIAETQSVYAVWKQYNDSLTLA